jgi:Predicted esterase of the alpha-beta hydrolase superfamily
LPATQIEALSIPFAAIATDLHSGAEVVLRSGDVIEAVRASIAVPGVFTPVRVHGRVLVDGGLSNPVPVSVVRAMGADQVIAVDLNHGVVDGRLKRRLRPKLRRSETSVEEPAGRWVADYRRVMADLKQRLQAPSAPAKDQFERWADREEPLPNMFEVLLASVNVMEMHITESRLRIEPPDCSFGRRWATSAFSNSAAPKNRSKIGYDAAVQALRGWNP